jgi:hypothetical protein
MNVQVIADPSGQPLRVSPPPFPAPFTTSRRRVRTASSTRSPRQVSAPGPTRDTAAPAAQSASPIGAGGRPSPQASRRSTALTPNSAPSSNRPSPPQALAAPAQATTLHHPHHKPRPGSPLSASRQLKLRLEKARCHCDSPQPTALGSQT